MQTKNRTHFRALKTPVTVSLVMWFSACASESSNTDTATGKGGATANDVDSSATSGGSDMNTTEGTSEPNVGSGGDTGTTTANTPVPTTTGGFTNAVATGASAPTASTPVLTTTGGTTNAVAAAAPCSTYSATPTVTGTLFAEATGISGIVASRKQPGVFWIHSDRQKILYAVDKTGTLLGKWTLTSSARYFYTYNWEDIGIQPTKDGPDRIWVGDIGNNYVRGGGDPRTSIRLMSIDEPTVDRAVIADGTAPIIGDFELTYPDALHDAEGMSVDPLTGDVYVFAKEETAPSKIFRAKAPLQSGVLEELGSFDATNLNAADFSPSGRELVVRNYSQAYYWALPDGKAWIEVIVSTPKTFRLKWTSGFYSEAIGFAADETGLYAVSEEEEGGPPSPVEFYPKTCK